MAELIWDIISRQLLRRKGPKLVTIQYLLAGRQYLLHEDAKREQISLNECEDKFSGQPFGMTDLSMNDWM